MLTLFLGFSAVYGLTALGLRLQGYSAALPLSFVPFLGLLCLPLAVSLVCAADLLDDRLGSPAPAWRTRAACIAAGVGITYYFAEAWLWIPAAVALLICRRSSWTADSVGRVVVATVVMVIGYAAVWNANYLGAALVAGRRIDDVLLAADVTLVGWLKSSPVTEQGLFPLVTHPGLFRLLEHAYAMLFPIVIVALLLVSVRDGHRSIARWLTVLFGAYGIGLLIFLVVPAVGPPIHAPDTFREEFAHTWTGNLMRLMATEYRSFHDGGALTGFGYFVALPSLHVTVAVLVQMTLRRSPILFWMLSPVTVLLIASTVLLGYHYILDLPAGLFLGLVLSRFLDQAPVVETV